MKEKIKIYKLIDPDTLNVMYIGRTIHSMSTRIRNHYKDSKKNITPKDKWIQNLVSNNKKIIYDIIEYVEQEEWAKREEFWINYYSKINPNLCNISSGPGLLNVKFKATHIKAMSKAKGKSVYQLDKSFNCIALYNSCKEASKAVNISDTCINIAARSKGKKTAKGFVWIYLKDYEEWKLKKPSTSYYKDYTYLKHAVSQYDKEGNKIKEWSSLTDAAKELNINVQGITKAKIGYRKTYKGFIWK
jgi:hypothetical protein